MTLWSHIRSAHLSWEMRKDSRYYCKRSLRNAILRAVDGCAVSPGTLLDFGCGEAPYRPILSAKGLHYIGADFSGGKAADLTLSEEGTVPLPDGACDIVLSTQVLEHVVSPVHYLAECHRLLREHGSLILSTHGVWPYHPHPVDLWRWTHEGLRLELDRGGFEVESFEGVLGQSAIGLQLLQDALEQKIPGRLHPGYFAIMQTAIQASDWLLGSPSARATDSSVFVVRARKR